MKRRLLRRSSDEVNSGLLFKLDSGDRMGAKLVAKPAGSWGMGEGGFVGVIRGREGRRLRLRATVVVSVFSPICNAQMGFAIDGWVVDGRV